MVLLVLVLFSNLSFGVSTGGFYPDGPIAYAKTIKNHIRRLISQKSPEVFYLKDRHEVDQGNLFADLIQEISLQTGDLDCLFLELPDRPFQTAIDKFMVSKNREVIIEADRNMRSKYQMPANPTSQDEIFKILAVGLDLGLKIFAIDQLPIPEIADETRRQIAEIEKMTDPRQRYNAIVRHKQFVSYHYGYVRNLIFSKRIGGLMTSICNRGVAILGSDHIDKIEILGAYDNVLMTPVQLLLNEQQGMNFAVVISE